MHKSNIYVELGLINKPSYSTSSSFSLVKSSFKIALLDKEAKLKHFFEV